MLEDRVDVAPVRRHAGDRLAGQQDLALGRLLEAGDHAQGRRLAAARRPEQRVELAARDAQVHAVDGRDVAEPLGDPEDLDVGRRRPRAPRPARWRGQRDAPRERPGSGRRSTAVLARWFRIAARRRCSRCYRVAASYGREQTHRQRSVVCESRSGSRHHPRPDSRRTVPILQSLNATHGGAAAEDIDIADGTAARRSDPGPAPGAPADPARRRRTLRRDRELPVAGRARRDQPVDRDRPAHRPGARPVDRPALRRGARRPGASSAARHGAGSCTRASRRSTNS